ICLPGPVSLTVLISGVEMHGSERKSSMDVMLIYRDDKRGRGGGGTVHWTIFLAWELGSTAAFPTTSKP
ncbi:hypothetical protein HAX54_002046, partial [Datura stramonium]|nr:hypothetical protein [Datura stramonium]